MQELKQAYAQATELSQKLKQQAEDQPQLESCVALAEKLTADLGWLWVKTQ